MLVLKRTSRTPKLVPTALATALMLVATAGCKSEKTAPTTPDAGITRTATEGPVTLSLTVSKADLDYTYKAEVRLTSVAPQDMTVNIEDYRETLKEAGLAFEMRLVEAGRDDGKPYANGTITRTTRYTLSFVLPGEYELPAASASFMSDDSKDGAARELTRLGTEGISILARDPANRQVTPEELSSITVLDPRELPTLWSRWWWLTPIAAATLAVLLLITVPRLRKWLRRRLLDRPKPVPPPVPADVWAREQLIALAAEHLLDRGLIQEFHYRISFIVRGYIERRYGVTAAEMTTEEFLAAAIADARFGPDITEDLKRFLAACDLVKYARHEPSGNESTGAISAAESFVQRTRGQQEPGR